MITSIHSSPQAYADLRIHAYADPHTYTHAFGRAYTMLTFMRSERTALAHIRTRVRTDADVKVCGRAGKRRARLYACGRNTRMDACTHSDADLRIHVYAVAHIHACIQTRVHETYIRIHAYADPHIHACIHTRILETYLHAH